MAAPRPDTTMNITDHGIHIVHGEVAAATWSMVFGAKERLLVHRDDLICGPLRDFDFLATWTALRQDFWNIVSPEWARDGSVFGDHVEPCEHPGTLERLRDASEIYLWAGDELHDQLFVLFTVHLLEWVGTVPSAIHVVPFHVRPHHNGRYISMGCLSPEDLKQHPEPVKLSQADFATCRAAWTAITSNTPEALVEFTRDGRSMPRHILLNLLRRYPKRETGLSLWDSMLLARIGANGPNAARVIAEVLCDIWETGDSTGDGYLFYRLKQMASTRNPQPLLQLKGSSESYREAEVTLTDFGRTVLEGRASSYPTNPIDEWIGGVHLSSAEDRLWFYEDGVLHRHRIEA